MSDVIKMANEVFEIEKWTPEQANKFKKLAALIRADERERCAKKIESTAKYFVDKPKAIHIVSIETRKLQADEIRAMED